jgi:hypothetical protein
MGHSDPLRFIRPGRERMPKNDGPSAPTPEARARRLAELFFPRDEVKALHAATLIATEIREAVDLDRWGRLQAEAWVCRACSVAYSRGDLVHRGLAELCPVCSQPACRSTPSGTAMIK